MGGWLEATDLALGGLDGAEVISAIIDKDGAIAGGTV